MFTFRLTTLAAVTLILALITAVMIVSGLGRYRYSNEITFVRTDTRDIYTMDMGMGVTWQLLRNVNANPWFGWSRDGEHLAFTSAGDTIHVFDVRANTIQNYAIGEGLRSAQEPSWSPDSRYIAFHAQDDVPSFHIYLLRLTDGAVFPLGHQGELEVGAAWSPISADGTLTLVFQALDRTCGADLYMVDISDGVDDAPQIGEARRLTECGYQNMRPEWSPDGQQLVYYASPLSDGLNVSPPEVYVMDVASATSEQLTTFGNAYYPAWSPNGQQIVFTLLDIPSPCRVYVMDVASTDLSCLSHDTSIDIHLAWRP